MTNELSEDLRKAILAPARAREYGLTFARLVERLFDEMSEALRSGHWRPELVSDLALSKKCLMKHLEEGGQARYDALVRQRALSLLESRPGDSASDCMDVVESDMLEVACGSHH